MKQSVPYSYHLRGNRVEMKAFYIQKTDDVYPHEFIIEVII